MDFAKFIATAIVVAFLGPLLWLFAGMLDVRIRRLYWSLHERLRRRQAKKAAAAHRRLL